MRSHLIDSRDNTQTMRTFNLFVCLEFFVLLENFSLILRCQHYRWRAANFDLCSALMAIERWGFFRVPHLLWLSHLLSSVWQWNLHFVYLFLRLRSVVGLQILWDTVRWCHSQSKHAISDSNFLFWLRIMFSLFYNVLHQYKKLLFPDGL